MPTTPPRPAPSSRVVKREESLGEDDLKQLDDDPYEEYIEQETSNLPPGRMHATRVPQRLSGSKGDMNVNMKGPRSRSVSPSQKTTSGDSSISSLENVDQDILLDRAGLSELDERKIKHQTKQNLTPVNERLSEETLDDVHAFSDVKSSNTSRANSQVAESAYLEALDEIDEEGEEDIAQAETAQVIVNMENLTMIQEDQQ